MEATSTLPEVIVVATRNASGSLSYTNWYNLWQLLDNRNNIPLYVSAGTDGTTSGTDNTNPEGIIEVEFDGEQNVKSVDIEKIFKCFDLVNSNGASYAIKLNVDLPVNNDPFASVFGDQKSAVGHVFISLTKSNGVESITQVLGFYPARMPSFLDPENSVPSSISDDGESEVNARILMNLNESQFNHVIATAKALSTNNYNLKTFNCTDFALTVYNSVRQQPITISAYNAVFPNPYNPNYPNIVSIQQTPQMLFSELKNMKSNGFESDNILIDQSKSTRSMRSKGECN
jgi:hypothetical protein